MICAVLAAAGVPAHAQWLGYLPPGTPLTAEGKADMTAKAPRTPWDTPDLTGTYHIARTARDIAARAETKGLSPVESYTANIFRDIKPEEIPETEAGKKVRLARTGNGKRADPSVFCLPMGIPLNNTFNEVTKFVQAKNILMILFEVDGTYRQVYLDGRKLPEDPSPAWMGYSTGHWEGDTLVVETAGFNDKSWLDMAGHSHSEQLHVTERYHRRDFGHLDVEVTLNDPVMYSKPFKIQFTHTLLPDSDILESYCNENEKDRQHLGLN